MEAKDYLLNDIKNLFAKNPKVYQHFKGHIYLKVGESLDTEFGMVNILYRRLTLDQKGLYYDPVVWSRPINNFNENVPYTFQPRFKLLTQEETYKLLLDEFINNNLKPTNNEDLQ